MKTGETFIVYLDDNDPRVQGFYKLLETAPLVKFVTTSNNIITIPPNRIIKIKEKIGATA